MTNRAAFRLVLGTLVLIALAGLPDLARALPPRVGIATPAGAANPASQPDEKDIAKSIDRGLVWLAGSQNREEGYWSITGAPAARLAARGNERSIADTCMAVMAFCDTGSTPAEGKYHDNVLRGTEWVIVRVEKADADSPLISPSQSTHTQGKLGDSIDTYMAAQMLAQVKDAMPDAAAGRRAGKALAKLVHKIEADQNKDGRWVQAGWEPARGLAEGQALLALRLAADHGAAVDHAVLARADAVWQKEAADFQAAADKTDAWQKAWQKAQGDYQAEMKAVQTAIVGGSRTDAAAGRARRDKARADFMAASERLQAVRPVAARANGGVELYALAGHAAAGRATTRPETDPNDPNAGLIANLRALIDSPSSTEEDIAQAKADLAKLEAVDHGGGHTVYRAIVGSIADPRFIAGLGSCGGEEYLSYLDVGQALHAAGGQAWVQWDQKMVETVLPAQNADGSWTGYHCITQQSFCTAAAVRVLALAHAPGK